MPQRHPREVPDPNEWLRKIAYAAPDSGDPWTWRCTGRSEADEVIWKYRYMELQDAGLIIYTEGESRHGRTPGTHPRGALTDAGRKDVERRAEQRRIRHAERRARRRQMAAIDGLLYWFSEHDPSGERWSHVDGVLQSRHAIFEDEPLPESLFRRAAEHLQQKGLLRGDAGGAEMHGPLVAQITIKGQDCIESGGSVADYLSQGNDHPANITTTFNAPVSGNIALHSAHVTQTATTTGIASDEIGVLVRAIVEALPALGLPEEQAAVIRSNTTIIEGELARSEQDPHIVKTMMSRTLEVLTGATATTLGLLLTGYAKELMRNAGLPID